MPCNTREKYTTMNKITFNMDAAIEKYEQIIAMTEPTTSTEPKSADKRTRESNFPELSPM